MTDWDKERDIHKELIIELDPSDMSLPRATQRWIAERIATEEMDSEHYTPCKPTHPHATLVKDGVWSVRGWWRKG